MLQQLGRPEHHEELHDPSSYVGQVVPNPDAKLTVVDNFSTNAQIIFLAACDTGASSFQSLWSINNNTTGQALIIQDISQFSGGVDLGHAATAWQTIVYALTVEGHAVGAAVAEGNQSMQTLNEPERWTVIGDPNVKVAH